MDREMIAAIARELEELLHKEACMVHIDVDWDPGQGSDAIHIALGSTVVHVYVDEKSMRIFNCTEISLADPDCFIKMVNPIMDCLKRVKTNPCKDCKHRINHGGGSKAARPEN